MKLLALILLASPLVLAFSLNPPAEGLVSITQENAIARYPELANARARDTNARRLAEGLPLLAPHSTRKQYAPSGVQHAPRENPSSFPLTGALRVTDDAGNDLGYVSAPLNDFGEHGLTQDPGSVLAFSANIPSDPSRVLDIRITNPAVPAFPFFGATVGHGSSPDKILRAGSANYLFLTDLASSTGSDSRPQNIPNTWSTGSSIAEASESMIWKWDGGEVRPYWTNADGSQPDLHIVYYKPLNFFIVTAGVDVLRAGFYPDLPIVHLYTDVIPPS